MNTTLKCMLLAFVLALFSGSALTADAPLFSLVISSPQSTVKSGEQIALHIVLTNTSDKPLLVREGTNYYDVDIAKGNGSTVRDLTGGLRIGKAQWAKLTPGETDVYEFALEDMYDIKALGTYVMRVSRMAGSVKTEDGKMVSSPVSNLIRVTVTN